MWSEGTIRIPDAKGKGKNTVCHYWVKHYEEPSETYGINGGRISKGNTAQMTFFVQKEIPTMKNDRNDFPKCSHMRTDSSCQAGPVSQNQIRKCE